VKLVKFFLEVMAVLVAVQPLPKKGVEAALLVLLVQVKMAVTYLVPLTHLVRLGVGVELTAALPRLVETLLAQQLRVLGARVMGVRVAVRLQRQVRRLGAGQMVAAGAAVKTPLGS
jgi:hypothetical protein